MAGNSKWLALFPALCGLSLSSCIQVGLDSLGTKANHHRKEESLSLWKDRKVGRSGASDYLIARTAVLFGGATDFNFDANGNSITVRARSAVDLSVGSAAAVSADGYYLTAAHCLSEKNLRLVGHTGKRAFVAKVVRTVWSGQADGLDLALIYIEAAKLPYFHLGESRMLQTGKEVLAGGVGGLKLGLSAGEILSVRDRQGGAGQRWKALVHSAPLIHGDSGGPVMNEEGHLVGITSTGGAFGLSLLGKQWVHTYRSGAIWVDPAWMRSLIAEDRRKLRAGTNP